jgi:hypothetical protein
MKKRKSTITDQISTHLGNPTKTKNMDKENTRKGPNQQNYQETHTIIVNGVKYTNVPEKTRKEIEKIAKMYGTLRK